MNNILLMLVLIISGQRNEHEVNKMLQLMLIMAEIVLMAFIMYKRISIPAANALSFLTTIMSKCFSLLKV